MLDLAIHLPSLENKACCLRSMHIGASLSLNAYFALFKQRDAELDLLVVHGGLISDIYAD